MAEPPPTKRVKIFLSYRRTHADKLKPLALNLQESMDVYFVDDRFAKGQNTDQSTNEKHLCESQVVLILISQAPSGPSGHWAATLSSMEMMKRCDDLGGGTHDVNDYCLDEIRTACKLNKIVIPVYAANLSEDEVRKEMKIIKHITGLSNLAATNVSTGAFRLTSSTTKLEQHISHAIQRQLAEERDNRQDGHEQKRRMSSSASSSTEKRLRKSKTSGTLLMRAGSSGNVLSRMSGTRNRRKSFALGTIMNSVGAINIDIEDDDYDDEDSSDSSGDSNIKISSTTIKVKAVDDDHHDREKLRQWLESNGMSGLKTAVIDTYGATSLDDIEHITKEEWKELGVKPAKSKKLLRTMSSIGSNVSDSRISSTMEQKEEVTKEEINEEENEDDNIIDVVTGASNLSLENFSKTNIGNTNTNMNNTQCSINMPGQWDVFISYTQHSKSACLLALNLYLECKERKLTCWLDTKMNNKGEAAMREGVMNCKVFIPIISGPCLDDEHPSCTEKENAYFGREYCRKECRWAIRHKKRIQPVVNHSDKHLISNFMKNAPSDLKSLQSVQFLTLDHSDDEYWKVGTNRLFGLMKSGRGGGGGGCCVIH
jgi:hypothetical protein